MLGGFYSELFILNVTNIMYFIPFRFKLAGEFISINDFFSLSESFLQVVDKQEYSFYCWFLYTFGILYVYI